MSLLRRNMTRRLLKANQSNSKKSTGPRTELGKRHASRNAGKHLVFARVAPPYMKELGEDPAEFERVRDSLWRAFEPQDDFEAMLVGDMTEYRWRRYRLLRAEAGNLVTHVPRTQKGNGRKLYTALCELWRLDPDPDSNETVKQLTDLKLSIQNVGFRKDARGLLDRAYGIGAVVGECAPNQYMYPILRAALDSQGLVVGGCAPERYKYLVNLFDECCAHPENGRSEGQESQRRVFLHELDSEIASLRELVKKDHETVEGPPEVQDAKLLLPQEHLDRIVRYEAHLERQFETKVAMLVSWRRAKGEAVGTEALSLIHR